jgi:stage V sporulation protein K
MKIKIKKAVESMFNKFNKGDIVAGRLPSRTHWFDIEMKEGEVISVNATQRTIAIKVLKHRNTDIIRRIGYDLPWDNYDLVRRGESGSPFSGSVSVGGFNGIASSSIDWDGVWEKVESHNSGIQTPVAVKPAKKEIDYDNLKSLKKLNDLNGLTNVKQTINEIVAHACTLKWREEAGLKNSAHSLHMIFKGNPGTGKTTVARIIGEIMRETGILKGDKSQPMPFIELIHTDIESPYVGKAEQNVKEKFQEAKGGVIFIDEAYSFVGHSHKQDIVTTIVKLMEDMRDEVLVIAAGYDKDMERFLDFNTGLRSRFTNVVHFEDYTMDELLYIADNMCKDQDYKMDESFISRLKEILEIENKMEHFGNARTVRNIVEKAIRAQGNRLFKASKSTTKPTPEQLMQLTKEDIIYDEKYAIQLTERKQGKEKVQEMVEIATSFSKSKMDKKTNID